MVTTVTGYTDRRNRAEVGEGYDGVVRVNSAGAYGSGALLEGGLAVLTAAHLFSKSTRGVSVDFQTSQGLQTLTVSKVSIFPDYDEANESGDLAILWLSGPAPVAADRYALYRHDDEVSQLFTLVGYGQLGSGRSGATTSNTDALRILAKNRFDAVFDEVEAKLGDSIDWSPEPGTQLLADFDDGSAQHDAFGQILQRYDKGLGISEGLIAPGDSGGPAFIDGQLAGVATYVASISYGVDPDIDGSINSSYGEVAAWQRVSAYQNWIDQTVRDGYRDAPLRASEVKNQVAEGDSGITFAYFMVRYLADRAKAPDLLSVDYATRNGTALAGEDYIAVQGTLNLYADETYAVIPVEIIGDAKLEADEYFYLDVSNPVGGSFGDGVVTLTAVRTILNDDGGSL